MGMLAALLMHKKNKHSLRCNGLEYHHGNFLTERKAELRLETKAKANVAMYVAAAVTRLRDAFSVN